MESIASRLIGITVLSMGACAAAAGSDPGGDTPDAPLRVSPAGSGIKIDGTLDEPAWNQALKISLDYEWFPGDGVPPPVQTECLITYDSQHLYVAFRALDPEPDSIRAHLMDRDAIETFVQDDHVLLMIDPFNDERRGFQFRVNPLGVQADAVFSEVEGIEDFSWDIIWSSAGRITREGYVVELAIPLNQIRFPSTAGAQTWGFDIGRSYPRSVRHRIASYYRDRNRNCLLCQVNKVSGFAGLEPGRNLELAPTLTVSRADAISTFPDGDLESGSEDYEPGLTTRWSVTPSLTVNAALNPDFSQVEADVAQLAVNERFALFFPERRPFFLEAVDLFTTPIDAVFTRTINDMDWGGKLTGKQGKNAFGVFAAHDNNPPLLIIPSNQFSVAARLDTEVTTGVVRYRRDVGPRSTLGLLYTGREGDSYHNRVGGVDGFLRVNARNTVRFQYLRSDTQYPQDIATNFGQDADAFADNAFSVEYDYNSRNWVASLEYEDRGPDFRADAGFVPRVDTRRAEAFALRHFWGEPDDWYSQIDVGLFSFRTERHDGQLTDERIDLFANVSGPLQLFAEISLERNKEFFIDTLYENLDQAQLFVGLQPSGAIRLSAFMQVGDVVDFSNNQRADLFQLVPAVEVKLGRHLNAKLNHELRQLDVPGGELFRANLTQLRLVYQFNVRMFLRAILQRQEIRRELSLFGFCADDPLAPLCPFAAVEEDLFTQLLFSYKLNPQTVAFLGYSESRSDHFTDPTGQLLTTDGLALTDRFFFLKLGYAWIL